MTQQSRPKKIKWGIIGLGKIAHSFATDLLTIDDAELYAVASRNQEKADEFAKNHGATKAYGSYEDLANDPNIDAVYIATPHALHKENALMCLENGIAVLGEKPFAMNAEEVDAMIAKAKEKNVLLMEALWTYFLPHYQFVLKELKNKTYGDILKIESDFGFQRPYDTETRLFNKAMGGGSLLDIGIYPIFATLSTLGLPKNIEASATFFENGIDSSCNMVFNYDNHVKAHLKSSLLEVLPTQAIFYCEKGTIKINTQFHAPSTVTIIADGKEETKGFDYSTIGYNFETIHFNNLLKTGKTESDIMTFDFSKKLIKTLDDVRSILKLEY
ncbi:Glucose--fructose oxidoreductase precursor [Mariniflexile rhizosphaerae]|uniref:Gfo/Idh/MocA family protein n=1 Tax=unclassified Mariniflexile TaxID=2643887 RepID=UPI000CACA6E6|nr:Gfo/Idh/MocA family oxidoreductase [Mariniflexile sp. TRM1-10]AXP82961.1 Glucose--fructose oxidoreductase precursor [Mariniflexile sp. TRM1-10]PLB19633.1 MAG: Oxidoreductase domain protein [Flavobacteriaceae bacterium FS1-H7996/R]